MTLVLLFTGTVSSFGGDYDIGWFHDDWKIWTETDPNDIDNTKFYLKFLYSHSTNDDGWRKNEGGVKIKLKSVLQTDLQQIATFTCDNYGNDRNFNYETSVIDRYFSDWNICDESVTYATNQPAMSDVHVNECKANHFHYATMTLTPPARALNNNISVKMYGTWWRWGAGWADKYYDLSRNVMASYDVNPGKYIVTDVDIDEDGKLFARTERYLGNASKYSTYVLLCDSKEIDFYSPEIPNGSPSVAFRDHVVYFDASLAYSTSVKKLSTYSEAFMGEAIAVNKRVTGENVFSYQGFPVPENLTVSFSVEQNRNVVKWNCQPIPSYAAGGHWYLVRYDKTNQITTTFIVPFNSDSSTSYQYEDFGVRLGNSYTYRVYYQRDGWPTDRIYDALSSQVCEVFCNSDINLRSDLPFMHGNDIAFNIRFTPSVSDGFYSMDVYRDGYLQKTVTDIRKNIGLVSWTDIYDAENNPLSVHVTHDYRFVMYGGKDKRELQSVRITARSANSTAISDFSATLGVGSGGIDLQWKAARSYTDTSIDTMRIMRRDISSGLDFALLDGATELHCTSSDNSYSDKDNCKAGVIYEYRLQQLSSGQWADVGTTVGYVLGTGSVSGRVTYPNIDGSSNFTSASGVEIMLTPFSATNSSQRACPMRSRYLADANDSIVIDLTETDIATMRVSGYTLCYWMKNSSTGNRWQHFAYSGHPDSASVCLIRSDVDRLSGIGTASLTIANGISLTGADTYFDEIQLWTGKLSEEDIMSYSQSHLNGTEKGLIAYVPMDEQTNFGYSFDQALVGSKTRGHHARLTAGIRTDDNSAPVSFRTVTDEKGNFTVKGLPFDDGGKDIGYRLTPVYGAHSFSPTTQSILLTQDGKIHTEIDFTDNTTVVLSGTVRYQYGNFPVSGATVLVDGNPVNQTISTSLGEINIDVCTDTYGKYAVQTTPGPHTISLRHEGHTYVEPLISVDAQSDMKDIDFTDKTLMRVTGRVAGGTAECGLPLPAYQYARSNIGQATLYLRPTTNLGYTLNTTGTSVELGSGDNRINSTTTLRPYSALANSDTTVVITTDANSGEFCALLPPIGFTITAGSTRSVSNDELRAYDMPEITPHYDGSNGFVDTCIICYDSQPTVFLLDGSNNNDYGAIGLDTIKIGDKSFPLYSIDMQSEGRSDDWGISYTLGYPVIQGGSSQCFRIYAFQQFRNEELDTTYTYFLPEGTEISFVGSNINADESAAANTVTLDNEGSATYLFTACEPSSSYSGTLPLQAHFRLNNREYTYPSGAPLNVAIVGSNVSQGNGFITLGPDQLDYILHCPPGSGSKATLHSGSSIISSAIASNTETMSNIYKSDWFAGLKIKMATGYGIVDSYYSFFVKAGAIGDKSSVSTSTVTNGNTSYTISTVGSDISTATGPAFTGSNGDVFIGHSLSKIIGKCYHYDFTSSVPADPKTQVDTLRNSNGDVCYLVGYEGNVNAMAALDTTAFVYTRYHIEHELLPQIVDYRNNMILPKGTVPAFEPDDSSKVKYVSLVSSDAGNFGEYGTYTVVPSPYASELEKKIDAVSDCNQWLSNWQNLLASDEQRRIEADYSSTVTVSAGAHYSNSIEREVSENNVHATIFSLTDIVSHGFSVESSISISTLIGDTRLRKFHDDIAQNVPFLKDLFRLSSYSKRMNECLDELDILADVNNEIDMRMLEVKSETFDLSEAMNDIPQRRKSVSVPFGGVSGEANFSWIEEYLQDNMKKNMDTKTASIRLSYTISDSDPYDYLTVSVSDTTDVSSLCYRLEGGATTNPWEGPEVSKYYAPGTTISHGTLKVERPIVRFEQSVQADVPSGHDATFLLHITNGSETNVAQYYTVELQSLSNPDGLSVMMDGLSLAQQRIKVWLEAGETVTKTITVRQTRQDILDYEDVQLVVSGLDVNLPEYENLELRPNINFSVHYKPSCSDISLSVTDRSGRSISTLNQVTSDIARFTVSGYDLDYRGFQKIQLQRYDRSGQQWQTFHEWYLDSSEALVYGADSVCGRSSLSYDWPMRSMADDSYRFRAVTCGVYGTDPVSYETPEQTLVKDVTPPYAMTTYPISGTLTSDGEVSVTFNEDIYKERVVDANITVTGNLNLQPFQHNYGIQFSASDPVLSSSPLRISDQSSSIEMWVQHLPGVACTAFSHGDSDHSLAFGFDSDDHLWVRTPSGTFTTTWQFSTTMWYYVHVGIENHRLRVAMLWNDEDGTPHQEWVLTPDADINYNERAVVRLGMDMYGRMSQITLWNTSRNDIAEIASGKDTEHSIGEEGIQSYWPCKECHGLLASDLIHECHLVLPNQSYWYNSVDNWAAYFCGTDSLAFSTDTILGKIRSTTDITLEMWIRAEKTSLSHQTVLLTGTSGITLEDGRPYLGHIRISDTDLRDDQWHHLAISILRNKSMNFYLDGNETRSTEAGQIVVGFPMEFYMGIGYQGFVDELRMWNATLTGDAIRDGMYKSMTGTEKGLIWYENMEDSIRLKTLGTYLPTIVSPTLRPVNQEQSVRHTWTVSDRKIVIRPTEPAASMEGCTLRFTVDKISDVHGNDILVPVTWTAVVKRTTLSTDSKNITLETRVGEQCSDRLSVTNHGSGDDVVSISNIPSWLTLSDDAFTLQPLESRSLELTVPAGVPSGIYETSLQLHSTRTGITDIVGVRLKVNAIKPDWTVTGDLPATCSVLSAVQVGNGWSEDESDELVVYVNDVHGSPIYLGKSSNAYLSAIGSYRFFLDIHYDARSHESGYRGLLSTDNVTDRSLKYLFWDNSEGRIYKGIILRDYNGSPIALTLDNMEDFHVYGAPLAPCVFHTGDMVDQTIDYSYGWNWVSLNVRPEGGQLSDCFPVDGSLQRIKTQDWFAECSSGIWHTDKSLTPESLHGSMYLVESVSDRQHTIEGTCVTPSSETIQVRKGWNWLPYYPSMNMPLGYALNGIHTEGDIIKGQDGFAYYIDGEWIGSLTYLKPGHGYMYYATESKDLTYPDSYVPTYRVQSMSSVNGNGEGIGTDTITLSAQDISRAYPFNMCCVITPQCDGCAISSGIVYACDMDGNLRGLASVGNVQNDQGMAEGCCFLTISGDADVPVRLFLKDRNGTVWTSEENISYSSNSMLGTPANPKLISFRLGNLTDMHETCASQDADGELYDLFGRRAGTDAKGIVISGGVKMLNK